MSLLLKKPPEVIDIEGFAYHINADFRISIQFETLMGDGTISERDKTIKALQLYYPTLPENLEIAINKMIWFYKCGKEEKQQRGVGAGNNKKIYEFEHDDDYIYAAFLDQYGIDLADIDYLHWWKFKAMFKALKEDNQIVKIMGYRSMKTDSKMSKEQQRFYRNMQKMYEIPLPKNEQQKINSIEEALLNGGDVSQVL